MAYTRQSTANPLGFRPWQSRLGMMPVRAMRPRTLSGLGDAGKLVMPGQLYTYRFLDIGSTPFQAGLDSLRGYLAAAGYDVRSISYGGSIVGGNTLTVAIAYNGAPADADAVGSDMANQLSQGWLLGNFVYQGASGPFGIPAGTAAAPSADGSTGIAPAQQTTTGIPPASATSTLMSQIFLYGMVGILGLVFIERV